MPNIIREQLEQERELKRLQALPRFAVADRELARLFIKLIGQFPTGKTEPEPKRQKPSKELVKWMTERSKVRRWNDTINRQAPLEQSFDQLEGEWRDWLEVAKRYEHKVPSQDRLDVRHDIMIELARARARDGKSIPILRAYRIASLTVALYWRERNKPQVKVCVLNGRPTMPDHNCSFIGKPSKCSQCPFLAVRPIESLDSEATDSEGNRVRLIDTVADDNAIDLDLEIDVSIWRLGCPMRLIEIATKRRDGKPLTTKDRMYLCRYRRQAQKSLF